MSGFFKRKKEKNEGSEDSKGDRYLDLIATKVNDADGEFFGEVVSADSESFVIKHAGGFYRFPVANVQNKFGDLMLTSNIDLNLALKQGEEWKDPGKGLIRENKFYDFSEKRRLEQERTDRIAREMEMARELAVRTMPPEPDADEDTRGGEGEDEGNEDVNGDDEDIRSGEEDGEEDGKEDGKEDGEGEGQGKNDPQGDEDEEGIDEENTGT